MKSKFKIIFHVCMFTSISLFLSACFSRWNNILEGNYNDKKYILQERETKGFSTNSLDWRLKLGNLPAIAINPNTTSWGPPYSDDIFGKTPFVYFTEKAKEGKLYDNTDFIPGVPYTVYTMVYVSPRNVSKEQFVEYSNFLNSELSKINDIPETSNRPHIIGLVYGDQEDFVQDFKGIFENEKMILRVEVDGRIRFVTDDKNFNGEMYSGLSGKVQMPGKKIYINSYEKVVLTISQLSNFKNKNNVPVNEIFDFSIQK